MPAKVDGRSLGVAGRVLPKPAEAGLSLEGAGDAGGTAVAKKAVEAKKPDKPVFKDALKQASKKAEGSKAEEEDDRSNTAAAKKAQGKAGAQAGRAGKKKAAGRAKGGKKVGKVGDDAGQAADVDGNDGAPEVDGYAPAAIDDGSAEEGADAPEEQAGPAAEGTDDGPVDPTMQAAEQGVVQPAATPAIDRQKVSKQGTDDAGRRTVEGVGVGKDGQASARVLSRNAIPEVEEAGGAGPAEGGEAAVNPEAAADAQASAPKDEARVASVAKAAKGAKGDAAVEVSAGEGASPEEKAVVPSAPAVLPDAPPEEAPDDADALEELRAKAPEVKGAQVQAAVVTAGAGEAGAGKGPDHASGQAGAVAPAPVEVRFAEANHAQIVSAVRGELLPRGGTMHIRLDPPELGALQVTVHVRDGVVTASFQTSNEDATRLLSHSLSELKHVLESQGVSVEKLHVQQGPADSGPGGEGDARKRQDGGEPSQQEQWREHQRREMMRRVWAKLADADRPLDVVG